MSCLLGIDSGLTMTKAVVFDARGTQLSVARRKLRPQGPEPRFVERDMAALWTATAEAISEAVSASGRPASDIVGVAATAHGDGLYLLDGERRPLGQGILSLDSRAGGIVAGWETDGVADASLALTGQVPHVSAPSALLAWIRETDPSRFARIGHVLSCKDWLRFCLTGEIATDRTEASTAFTDVLTQAQSPEALRLFGLEGIAHALPRVLASDAVAGYVTAAAASLTGLCEGTPVAAGLHDVTASALGICAQVEGVVGIVAGTYSINEVISNRPRTDRRWFCRNAVSPGQWNNMAISPASAVNYDWFLDTLCIADQAEAAAQGRSIHTMLAPAIDAAIDAAMARRTSVMFHPYLYGAPQGDRASGSFTGLRGWHDRSDMLRAVLEGIAFNHRVHVDALRSGFTVHEARLTGGISRNPAVAQMFADVLGMPVAVTDTEEAAAWGAALCAGTAVGLFSSVHDDPRDLAASLRRHIPDAARSADYDRSFALHGRIADAMAPLWPEIGAMEDRA